MRQDGEDSSLLERHRSPRIVVGIIFPTGSIYLSNRTGISNVPGNHVSGVLKNPSASSQSIYPDEGRSVIGTFSFEAIDLNEAVTDQLFAQWNQDRGPRFREVRVWTGDTDNFNDFTRVETYVIDSMIQLQGRTYRFSCSDRSREQRVDIFEIEKTRLSQSLDVDATTVNVLDTTGFTTVAHTAAFSDAPSATVGYIRLKKTGEIIRYTGKTATSFTGCTREVLGTVATPITVDAGTPNDRKPEVEELIYLEMPGPQLLYALQTGKILGTADTLPAAWHMGIDEAFIDSDQYDAIGADLYDPSDAAAGFILRFTHLDKVDGKRFAEEQLHVPMGTYAPISAEGVIGLRRMAGLISTAAYNLELNESNVRNIESIQHTQRRIVNELIIDWNYTGEAFTRRDYFINQSSIAAHGRTKPKKLSLRGLHVSKHSRQKLNQIFATIADRYGSPPIEVSAQLSPTVNHLEVGDIVRLSLGRIQDMTTGAAIARSFEMQSRSMNWQTGRLNARLFGSTARTLPDGAGGSGAQLADSFFTATGTNLTSVLTISGGAVTANGSISGGSDLRTAVFYYDGDLTINAGVTVTISANVQLRIKGTLTINGTLDGAGGGVNAIADPNTIDTLKQAFPSQVTQYFFGTTRAGSSIKYFLTAQYYSHVEFNGPTQIGVNQSVPRLVLSVNAAGTALSGIPADIRGTPGAYGSPTLQDSTVKQLGGSGGDSGAGLMIISRGLAFGASGALDLSGDDGSAPGSSVTLGGVELYGGGGSGGMPGALYVLLDGDAVAYPDLANTFTANRGNSPVTGTPAVKEGIKFTFPSEPATGDHPGLPGEDLWAVAHVVQYIPTGENLGESDDERVPTPDNLAASADDVGLQLTWDELPAELYDYVEVYESIDNDRNNAVLVALVVGATWSRTSDTAITRYYWIRASAGTRGYSDFEPLSATGGVSATFGGATGPPGDPGDDGELYYIKVLNGIAIKNGVGQLTIEAHHVVGAVDSLLAAGTIQLYDVSGAPVLVTAANGYVTGSDGYTGIFDAGDINGSVLVSLRDGSGGADLATVTLLDITDGIDGEDAVYAYVEPSAPTSWTRAVDQTTWSPAATIVDLDVYFVQAGVEVARIARRVTRDASGNLTVSTTTHKDGDLNTSRVTVSTTGSGTGAAAVSFAYSFGGDNAKIAQTVTTTLSGADGAQGDPGDDGEFYYIKPTNGTAIKNGSGTLTVEAHHVVGGIDTLLSAGTIQLYDITGAPVLITVANGYATGSDGYTGVVDAGDINGAIVIGLRDGSGGADLDTITLVDIDDGVAGDNATYAYIEPSGPIAWVRDVDQSTWTPVATTVDLDCTVVRGGSAVGRRAWRITRTAAGILTGAATTHKDGDLNTGSFTVTEFGESTQSMTTQFAFDDGSGNVAIAETVNTSLSGQDGAQGDPGDAGADAVAGRIEPSAPLSWTRAIDQLTWAPTGTTVDLDCFFTQGGVDVARIARRVTRTADGDLSVSTTTHKGGDLNTARVTVTVTGSGTRSLVVDFEYSFSGDQGGIAASVTATLSGEDGADGIAHGTTINKDPYFENWETHWFSSTGGAAIDVAAFNLATVTNAARGDTALNHTASALDFVFSERFVIDPAKTYIVEWGSWQDAVASNHHIAMQFFDENGDNISNVSTPVSDVIGEWASVTSNHYFITPSSEFSTTAFEKRSRLIGRGGRQTIPSNAKRAVLLWAVNTNAETDNSYLNYFLIREVPLVLNELPAPFTPGRVGGEDDFLIEANKNLSAFDAGEFHVFGTTFKHPDGTERSMTERADWVIQSPMGESKIGKFFIMWSDTDPDTRFAGSYIHANLCPVAYDDEENGWYAFDNSAATKNYFTPLSTDVLIGVGIAYDTSGGIDEFIKLTGTILNPERLDKGVVFKETFDDYADQSHFLTRWEETDTASNAPTITFPTAGLFGGKVLDVDSDEMWVVHRDLIPFDPNALYKISARWRRTVDGAGSPSLFIGVTGVGADGVTLENRTGANDFGNQHYVLASADTSNVAAGWQERSAYFQGVASTGENFTAKALTPLGPLQLHTDVRYIRPTLIASYDNITDAQWQIDYIIIEKVIDAARDTLNADPFFYEDAYGVQWEDDTQGDGGNASIGSGENGNALYLQPSAGNDIGAESTSKFEVINGDRLALRWRFTRSTGGDLIGGANGNFTLEIGVRVYDISGTFLGEQKVSLGNGTPTNSAIPVALTYYTKEARFSIEGYSPSSGRMYARVYAAIVDQTYTGSTTGTFRFDSMLVERQQAQVIFTGYVDSAASAEEVPYPWSVSRANTGDYTVTHNLGLSSPFSQLRITVNVWSSNIASGTRIAQLYSVGANSFSVKIWDASGNDQDEAFTFECVYDPWEV